MDLGFALIIGFSPLKAQYPCGYSMKPLPSLGYLLPFQDADSPLLTELVDIQM